MNKGKIYYIINNLLDKYDNGEKIEENMFIDALVKIRDIVEENTNKSLLDENYKLQFKIDKAIKYINENILNELTSNYDLGCDLLDILKEDK